MVIRFITSDWSIKQRLVALKMLQKSLTGEEIAREVICTHSIDYHISPTALLACMRDRAASNNVAVRTLKVLYPHCVDIGCFSHTLDHVGEKFQTPVLEEFLTGWINLFSHSPKNKALWLEQTGKSMKTYSATRWWSWWEVMEQLMVQFGDVAPFLQWDEVGSPSTVMRLRNILSDVTKKAYLQIELAAVIDFGRPFVTTTYKLEGDRALVLQCYEVVEEVQASVQSGHTPNIDAVVRELSTSMPQRQAQLKAYSQRCVQPGLDYFTTQLHTNLHDALAVFKAARLFSPHKLKVMQPVATSVDSLALFQFLNQDEILTGLKEELPAYIAKCSDVSPEISAVEWWKINCHGLLRWSNAAKQVLLLQPSSAAAERVFSLLTASFSEQQQHSLNNYVETLQYNDR